MAGKKVALEQSKKFTTAEAKNVLQQLGVLCGVAAHRPSAGEDFRKGLNKSPDFALKIGVPPSFFEHRLRA
jgi:hypothetical protein